MGITGGNNNVETQFHQDIEVKFTMSGSTDDGLSFGASIELDEAAWTDTADDGGTTVFVSSSLGTLTMGDTDGAFDHAMDEVPGGPGSIAGNHDGHGGYNGNSGLDGLYDGQVLSYSNTFGAVGLAASVELDDTGTTDPIIGLGVVYNMGDTRLGLGYQQVDLLGILDITALGASVTHTMGDLSIGANVSNIEFSTAVGDVDIDHVGIGFSHSVGAWSYGLNYGVADYTVAGVGFTNSGFGASAGYDLGGGAKLLFGYGSSDNEIGLSVAETSNISAVPSVSATDTNNFSFGLSMSF